jgi:hypothetical protein
VLITQRDHYDRWYILVESCWTGLTLTLGEVAYLNCRAFPRDDEGVKGMEEISIGEFARRFCN